MFGALTPVVTGRGVCQNSPPAFISGTKKGSLHKGPNNPTATATLSTYSEKNSPHLFTLLRQLTLYSDILVLWEQHGWLIWTFLESGCSHTRFPRSLWGDRAPSAGNVQTFRFGDLRNGQYRPTWVGRFKSSMTSRAANVRLRFWSFSGSTIPRS